jgi:hypothetical protein
LNETLKVFDDIERGKLRNIDFIEAYSCHQGCVGGSLTVENLYISYNKILKLIETLEFEKIKACPDIREVRRLHQQKYFFLEGKIEPRPLKPLDKDLGKAIMKRKEKEAIHESLPKIDCGACGSPTCLTFAEDVVRGEAELADCVFNLSLRSRELRREMFEPPDKSFPSNPASSKGEEKKKGKTEEK